MFDNGVIGAMYAPNAIRSPPMLCKIIPKGFIIPLEESLTEVVEMAYSGRRLNWCENAISTGKFSKPEF